MTAQLRSGEFKESVAMGTVKGPGDLPHEYLFVTADKQRTRIGEFVYYLVNDGPDELSILGNITSRRLVRQLPDAFLSDASTQPSEISGLIGLSGEYSELYEITVQTIGYFSRKLGDFVNPRIPPFPGDSVYIASSEILSDVLSSRHAGEIGSAQIGSLLTRSADEVPIVLSVKDVVSTHLAILASTGSGKSYTAGVLVEELMAPNNRAAVLIVDPHGEYHTLSSIQEDRRFQADDGYRPEIKVFTPDRIRVRFSTLTEADIKYLLPEGTSDKMLHFLSQAYRQLLAGVGGLYSSHSGNFGATFGQVTTPGTLSQTIATSPGASYTIDFWLKNLPGPFNANPNTPNFFSASFGGNLLVSLTDAAPFDYTEFTYNAVASASSAVATACAASSRRS